MRRRFINMFICTAIFVLLIPVAAHAAESGKCGDNLTWSLSDNGELVISGTGEMYDYDQITAPWYSVSLISNPITSITVEKGVTKIGSYAFNSAGKSVGSKPTTDIQLTLPEGVTRISGRAFYNSTISEINLPASISSLSSDTFFGCPALTAINISEDNKYFTSVDGVFFGGYGKILIKYPEAKQGTSYTIPRTVEQVGYAAFYKAEYLEKINFNTSLKEIREMAFCYCTSLEDISLPDSLEYIGAAAFAYAGVNSNTVSNDDGSTTVNYYYSIDSVTIPKNVSYIGENAFQDMKEFTVASKNKYYKSQDGAVFTKDGTKLLFFPSRADIKSYEIPDTVTSVMGRAFVNSQLDSLTVPDSVTDMGENTFAGSSIRSIRLSDNLKAIGNYMFYSCKKLDSISIPSSVTEIGDYAFNNCAALTAVDIPYGVVSIGTSALSSCTSLMRVSIPESVNNLPDWLFSNDIALQTVQLPDTLETIGKNIFYRCGNLKNITLPNSLTSVGEYAFTACTSLERIEIPGGVAAIGMGTFSGCTSLSEVTFNDGLKSIGQSAFYKCPIIGVDFPDSLKYIDEYAFHSTSFLEVRIPDSVEYIGSYAFQNCISLKNAVLSRKLVELKSGIFSGCTALETITAYDELKNVRNNAFKDCKNLTVIFSGTQEDFNNIDVRNVGNDAFLNAAVSYSVPVRENVSVIGDYQGKIRVEKELDNVNNKLVITVASIDGNTLPELTLYKAEYGAGETLYTAFADTYSYLTDLNSKVFTVDLPKITAYKIMLWDGDNTPLTNVINVSQ